MFPQAMMPFAQILPESQPLVWLGLGGSVLLLFSFFIGFVVRQYKRCPSNRILVIYGRVGT